MRKINTSTTYQLSALHPQELVDGHDHRGHLGLGDRAVVVEVVQSEGPAELLFQRSVEKGGQGYEHVLQDTKLSHSVEKNLQILSMKSQFS